MINPTQHTVSLQESRFIPYEKGMIIWIPQGKPLPREAENPVPDETIIEWVMELKSQKPEEIVVSENIPSRKVAIIELTQGWFSTINTKYLFTQYYEEDIP